jgi:hypothetical protein
MVPVERSRHEIERTLQRYGATKFAYGWSNDQGVIQFERVNRHIRFTLPLPYRKDFPDHQAGNGRRVSGEKEWEQACRRAWRALALVIKAKLEAVDAGIVTFEEEFMAQIVLPSGSTVGEFMTPQIERAYETGGMPALLPGEAS